MCCSLFVVGVLLVVGFCVGVMYVDVGIDHHWLLFVVGRYLLLVVAACVFFSWLLSWLSIVPCLLYVMCVCMCCWLVLF